MSAGVEKNEPLGEEGAADVEVVLGENPASVNIMNVLFSVGAFVMLTVFTIGVALPWFSRYEIPATSPDVSPAIGVTVWNGLNLVRTATTNYTIVVYSDLCEEQGRYGHAAASFAIISIFFALVMTVMGVAALAKGVETFQRKLFVVLSMVCCVTSLISWAIGARLYYLPLCGLSSFHARRFEVSGGLGLMVSGWVVATVLSVLSVVNPVVASMASLEAVSALNVVLFTKVSFVAFAFTVIGTPITTFHQWASEAAEVRVTEWRSYVYYNGVEFSNDSTTSNNDCGRMNQYFYFARASSIVAIFFCLCSFVVGVLTLKKVLGGHKWMIISGFFAFLWCLLKTAADLCLYYIFFCQALQSFNGRGFTLNAGFVLFCVSFVLLAVVLLLLIGQALVETRGFLGCVRIARAKQNAIGTGLGDSPNSTLIFLGGIVLSLLFTILATNQPLYITHNPTDYIRWYWWDMETRNDNGFVFFEDFACRDIWLKLAPGGALCVMSILPLTLAFLFGLTQIVRSELRLPAVVCGGFAAILQLVAWALGVRVFWGPVCDVRPHESGHIAVGLGLLVAGWVVTTLVTLTNYFRFAH